MLASYYKMIDFWREKSKEERSAYIKSHYLKGITHKPWQNMAMTRLVKILNGTKQNKYLKNSLKEEEVCPSMHNWHISKKGCQKTTKQKCSKS